MIHDLIPEIFPDFFTSEEGKRFLEWRKTRTLNAHHIIAVSEHTKNDLCRIFGISKEKVSVIAHGINFDFLNSPPTAHEQATWKSHAVNQPFFLQVGGRPNHKNFLFLLEAFALGKFHRQYDLVCVGEYFEENEIQLMKKLGIFEKVHLIHWADETLLKTAYHNASLLIYPSLYEGFGIPPLEAMAAGLPVVASDSSSIPEVCGDAALLFSPTDHSSLVKAIESAVDPAASEKLRQKGWAHAKKFTWERCAELTKKAYLHAQEKR